MPYLKGFLLVPLEGFFPLVVLSRGPKGLSLSQLKGSLPLLLRHLRDCSCPNPGIPVPLTLTWGLLLL